LSLRGASRSPQIPGGEQENKSHGRQRKRKLSSHMSTRRLTSYQAGYELRKEDDEEHNDGSAPKQSHADRAALRALFAATVELDKPYSHKNGGTAQQPSAE